MSGFEWVAFAVMGLVILSLSIYAGFLLAQLARQNKAQVAAQVKAIQQRNEKIIESVDVISLAALQQQCDLSEAAIRLYMIMDHLQGDKRVDFPVRFPALFALYDTVKDMPRGDARAQLAKKERMRLDYVRVQAEAQWAEQIEQELQNILSFTGAKFSVIQPMSSS